MARTIALLIASVACCIAAAGVAAAQRAAPAVPKGTEITPEMVRRAIDEGINYLKRQQRADGLWTDYAGPTGVSPHPGGVTSLCTLALLSAGVPTNDPTIERALAKLEKIRARTTYSCSLQTLVFCQSKPKQYLNLIQKNVQWLEEIQIKEGKNKGAWSYPAAGGDNSNTQFALLALHEAERAGATVRHETWTIAKAYWEEAQRSDGSWGYHKPGDTLLDGGTSSMTCAGITSMIVTSDRFRQSNARVQGGQILCCQPADPADDDRIQRGLDWLARNFSVTGNRGAAANIWKLYYLYGLERVGRLTNQRHIGEHDWYREGAEELVRTRDQMEGFWTGTGYVESDRQIGTAFALLFLAKGRRPVVLCKLQHTHKDDWNQHRSDVDNLVRYAETRWKRELTWQVQNLSKASVEDLLQSPVLYYCGSLSPLPDRPAQRQSLARKLRDYLDRGGFLFAEGYGGGAAFDEGFRQLMQEVFLEPEYRLRPLEPEHPIWRAEEPVPAAQMRPLWGIDFGCRTSVVYAPLDPPGNPRPSLSCLWELSRPGRESQYPPLVREQVGAGLSLGLNVLTYATNREVEEKEKLFRPQVVQKTGDALSRGKLYIAKIRHGGGCNAAPRALANLIESGANELKLRASSEERLISLTDETLFDYPLVFIHGRNAFRFTEKERQQLKLYLERGGMLFGDAICTSPAFAESLRREVAAIFPDKKLERIPIEDPMLTPALGGFDLKTVTRRDPQPQGDKGPLQATLRKVPPDLEGLKLDDRWAVVFSPFDLSCALEKHDSLDCRGYTRQDAARIGLNVVLYALQQ